MALRIREMSGEEHEQIKRLSQSRTAPARQVERARILHLAGQGYLVPAIAAQLQIGQDVVRLWLKRFNAAGLAGLEDRQPRGTTAHLYARAGGRGDRCGADQPQGPGPSVWQLDVRAPGLLPQRGPGHRHQAQPDP